MVTARESGFPAHHLGMSTQPRQSPRHRAEPKEPRHRGDDEPLTVGVRVTGELVTRALGRAFARVVAREALREAARAVWPYVRDVSAEVVRWLADLVGQWLG